MDCAFAAMRVRPLTGSGDRVRKLLQMFDPLPGVASCFRFVPNLLLPGVGSCFRFVLKSNFFFTSLALALLVSCSQAQVGEAAFHEMLQDLYRHTVPQVKVGELPADGSEFLFLDTREPAEFSVSHIPGARCVGYDDFDPASVADLPRDKALVVYCSVGYRSERIGEKLQKMGFTNVKNLYGGIFDWMRQEQPVVDADKKPTLNIHTYNRDWSKWAFRGNKVW